MYRFQYVYIIGNHPQLQKGTGVGGGGGGGGRLGLRCPPLCVNKYSIPTSLNMSYS